MTVTNLSMSISADGHVAGPDQSEEHPLGVGGLALHGWHRGPMQDHPVNRQVMSNMLEGVGATIMGRNMFGPIRGEWGNSDWKGWWGEVPPYHCPVFVLTHYRHDPIEMQGGTTFHELRRGERPISPDDDFVTDGIESARAQAKDACCTGRISIAVTTVLVPAQRESHPVLSGAIDRRVSAVLLGRGARPIECVVQAVTADAAKAGVRTGRATEWPTCATASCGDTVA